MKNAGVARRLDDVGRIVIPREIRKTFGIKSGDPIEFFLRGNEIVLKKYGVSAGMERLVERFNDEFSHVESSMDRKTADKIRQHIRALQELLGDIEEGK